MHPLPTSQVSREEAASELLMRRKGRTTMLGFMQYVWWMPGPFYVGRHTKLICEALDRAVERYLTGVSSFLDISVPFRHGKSDTLTKNGDDLAIVQNADGEACEICQAWDGVIISITGEDANYPSYQQSLNAGCFHPNCRCMAERVDETIDKEDIKRQADTDTPDFERKDDETDTQYRNRMTDEIQAYNEDFSVSPDNQKDKILVTPPTIIPKKSDVEIIRDQIRTANYTKISDLGGGVNKTFRLENGKTVVFKPGDGEHPNRLRTGIIPGEQYMREKAASIIDEILGFNLVPPTEIITYKGSVGSAQLFKDGFLTGEKIERMGKLDEAFKRLPKKTREQWALFDAVTENSDRHIGNFMMKLSGKKQN